MKFFIPNMQDKPEESEKIYKAIKDFAKETEGWDSTGRRIFRISYHHNGKLYNAEVGKINNVNHEPVVAILESTTYLICTPNRGVIRGEPILVGSEEITSIEDFES